MDSISCPRCHTQVKNTDYFCFNCGQNLKPKPPSTSTVQQLIIYLESFFLPPYGIILGMRYLKQNDNKSKAVGIIAIIITIISLYTVVRLTLDLIKTVNTGINTQLQGIEGF